MKKETKRECRSVWAPARLLSHRTSDGLGPTSEKTITLKNMLIPCADENIQNAYKKDSKKP